jgi:hypothetical protein
MDHHELLLERPLPIRDFGRVDAERLIPARDVLKNGLMFDVSWGRGLPLTFQRVASDSGSGEFSPIITKSS